MKVGANICCIKKGKRFNTIFNNIYLQTFARKHVSLIFHTQHLAMTTFLRGLATAYPLDVRIQLPAIPYTSDVLEQIHKYNIAAQIVNAIVMYYVGQHSYTDRSVKPKIKNI